MSKIIGAHIPTQIRNLIKNGGLDFWQQNGNNTTTINTTSTVVAYTADMFKYESGGTTNKNYSVTRSTDVPSQAQSGFQSTYSALFTMITGIASPATGDFVTPFEYYMEGLDYVKIHAKTITIGFWVKASVVGTYSFMVTRAGFDRTYATTFAVNGSNTWEFKTITMPMDTAAGYNFDNSAALRFYIGNVTGSQYVASTLNAWQAGGFLSAAGATNWQATSGATLRIAQFSVVEGPLGLGSTGFTRAGDDIAEELAMCQRYYEKSYDIADNPGTATFVGSSNGTSNGNGEVHTFMVFKATKRTTPIGTIYSTNTGASGFVRNLTGNVDLGAGAGNIGVNQMSVLPGTLANQGIAWHWLADARM